MSDTPVFELHDGRVSLGSSYAVDGIDLRLDAGEFLAVLGANGAGKTTLVRALIGLLPLAAGTLKIFGHPSDNFTDWSRIGYVPQRVAVGSGTPASVIEVVLTGRVGRARRLLPFRSADHDAAHTALGTVGMGHLAKRPIAQLSGGQQQRVLIARALVSEPDLLVLDEPVSGVDVDHQERLAETLRAFSAGGKTVLLVAHSLGAMEELVTREVVLDAGKVIYDGPHMPEHIHSEHVHHPDPQIEASPLRHVTGTG